METEKAKKVYNFEESVVEEIAEGFKNMVEDNAMDFAGERDNLKLYLEAHDDRVQMEVTDWHGDTPTSKAQLEGNENLIMQTVQYFQADGITVDLNDYEQLNCRIREMLYPQKLAEGIETAIANYEYENDIDLNDEMDMGDEEAEMDEADRNYPL